MAPNGGWKDAQETISSRVPALTYQGRLFISFGLGPAGDSERLASEHPGGRLEARAGSPIFGRATELAQVSEFLDATSGLTRGLRIEGEAGVGKTTLWDAAVRAARESGWRVLSASAAEQETKLAFAVLGDLVGDALDDVANRLAPPQRRAIAVALLRAESKGARTDRRAVGLAVTETIRYLAESTSILLAVDDIQWLDVSTAQALAFAARRLHGSAVGIVATVRVGPGMRDPLELERALPPDRLSRLVLGPLDPAALHQLLRTRSDARLSASLERHLYESSGGNPFFALELARAVERGGLEPAPGDPMPIPSDLGRLLRSRIDVLSAEARDLLLLVAAAGRPTVSLVRSLGTSSDDMAVAIAEAQRQEVIEVMGDRIRLAHPLLGSAVFAEVGPDRRRAAHLRLCRVVDDPIERAWHLALSTEGSDPSVASAVDEAAEVAESRGAPAIAAEMSELARGLTPAEDVDANRRRAVAGSQRLFEAGDLDRAIAQMEEVVEHAPPGPIKADVLHMLGHFEWMDARRVRELLDRALLEAGADAPAALRCDLHRAMAWALVTGGDLRRGASHAEDALALAEASHNSPQVALSLIVVAHVSFFLGRTTAIASIRRAVSLEGELRGIYLALVAPRRTLGALLMWAGDLDTARAELVGDYRQTVERGHLGPLWEVLVYLAELEVRAGNWLLAARYAAEGLDVVMDGRHEQAREVHLWSTALVAAHRGEVDVARVHASEGVRLASQHEDRPYLLSNASVLGFLELSLGNPAGAHEHLKPLVEVGESMGLEEPGIFPFLPDEIEALIALSELDQAEVLLDRLQEQAAARDRALALARAARCRGLLASARGDLDGAVVAVEEAFEHHDRVSQPFELARTLLVKGQIQRRQKRKRPARETLDQAVAIFDRIGAQLWAEKARAELGRIGGRAPSPTGLTPTELQVADRVGQGMTNREVAAALFMSEHTVRANLKRIYGKLGVRSRTELAARLGSDRKDHSPGANHAHTGDSPGAHET